MLVPDVTKARKAGLPEEVFSLYGLFSFDGALRRDGDASVRRM